MFCHWQYVTQSLNTYTQIVMSCLSKKILNFYNNRVVFRDLDVLPAVQIIGVCCWIPGRRHISWWRKVIAATIWRKRFFSVNVALNEELKGEPIIVGGELTLIKSNNFNYTIFIIKLLSVLIKWITVLYYIHSLSKTFSLWYSNRINMYELNTRKTQCFQND